MISSWVESHNQTQKHNRYWHHAHNAPMPPKRDRFMSSLWIVYEQFMSKPRTVERAIKLQGSIFNWRKSQNDTQQTTADEQPLNPEPETNIEIEWILACSSKISAICNFEKPPKATYLLVPYQPFRNGLFANRIHSTPARSWPNANHMPPNRNLIMSSLWAVYEQAMNRRPRQQNTRFQIQWWERQKPQYD